jgi:hypothetical protein
MRALPVSPEVTEVRFVGLDDLVLPFYSYLFDDADDEKYYVKSITGLEPPDRDIAIAATTAGGQFQGATTLDREVVAIHSRDSILKNTPGQNSVKDTLTSITRVLPRSGSSSLLSLQTTRTDGGSDKQTTRTSV